MADLITFTSFITAVLSSYVANQFGNIREYEEWLASDDAVQGLIEIADYAGHEIEKQFPGLKFRKRLMDLPLIRITDPIGPLVRIFGTFLEPGIPSLPTEELAEVWEAPLSDEPQFDPKEVAECFCDHFVHGLRSNIHFSWRIQSRDIAMLLEQNKKIIDIVSELQSGSKNGLTKDIKERAIKNSMEGMDTTLLDRPTYPRSNEIRDVEQLIADSELPARALWINGRPGEGKTAFAFEVAKRLFTCEDPIYIARGVENNIESIFDIVKRDLPLQLFENLNKKGVPSFESMTQTDKLQLVISTLSNTDNCIIIEAGECFDLNNENSFLTQILINSSDSQSNLKLIFTSRIDNSPNEIGVLSYCLEKLSLSDAISIIRSQVDLQIDLCEAIYNRYSGHALSILSCAKYMHKNSLSIVEDSIGLPNETIKLFQTIWNSLSDDSKSILLGFLLEPNLASRSIVPVDLLVELENSGLLSKYPMSPEGGPNYYLHQIACEACESLTDNTLKKASHIKILDIAIGQGLICYGTTKVRVLCANGRVKDGWDEFLHHARKWTDVCGISRVQEIISALSLYPPDGFNSYYYLKYIEGISHLFRGMYDKGSEIFNRVVNDVDANGFVKMVCTFELMDCFRRMGKMEAAFRIFEDHKDRYIDLGEPQDAFQAEYSGVTSFLIAHFYRSCGELDLAYQAYEHAERIFMKFSSEANEIEYGHCLYAKLNCSRVISQQNIDLERLNVMIKSTDSFFMKGLLSYLLAKHLAFIGKLDSALASVKEAKLYFQSFDSISYYQKALCSEGLLLYYLGDKEELGQVSLELAGMEATNSSTNIVKNLIVDLNAGQIDVDNNDLIGSVQTLLLHGKLSNALTTILIFDKFDSLDALKGPFTINLLTIENGKHVFIPNYCNTIGELKSLLAEKTSIDMTSGHQILV